MTGRTLVFGRRPLTICVMSPIANFLTFNLPDFVAAQESAYGT